jgi:hypothetical protein
MKTVKAWFFSGTDKKLAYNDGREISLGVEHTVDGKIVPCKHGLHASARILDAVSFAPGPILWEVELSGKIVEHKEGDKLAASKRRYVRGGVDVSDTLRAFARRCALDVADKWDMPDIMRRYLETGEEEIRREAAVAAAAYAAANATYAANAAVNAAVNATYAGAYGAAAVVAAVAANAYAAVAATYAANADAAYAAARKSAKDKYNTWLTQMIEERLGK